MMLQFRNTADSMHSNEHAATSFVQSHIPINFIRIINASRRTLFYAVLFLVLTITAALAYKLGTRQISHTQPQSLLLERQAASTEDSAPSPTNNTVHTAAGNDHTTTPQDQDSTSSNSTSVTVNGRHVSVPRNGSFDQTIDQSTVSGDSSQTTTTNEGSTSSHTTLSVNVRTTSGGE